MLSFNDPQLLVGSAVSFVLIYTLSLVVYRLFFSPIAGFPGPKIAAATGWYEFFYDVLKPGMYIYEIERMHAKYGPIVRINPLELSIRDADFYDELYVSSQVRKTDKLDTFCQGTGLEGSALLTLQHDLHRQRRRALDPHFSRSAVRKLEPLFQQLLARFEAHLNVRRGVVTRLDHAFVAFSGDVIRSITCEDIDFLMDDPEWSSHWFDLFKMVVMSAPLFTSFPWIIKIASLFSAESLTYLYPRGKAFVDFKNIARAHIVQAKQEREAHRKLRLTDGDSIFRKIVNGGMPETELDTERLTREAQALFGAATVAVARTLDCIAFYIIANASIRTTLANELASVMQDHPTRFPTLGELEKLPFLQGCVQEGFRLSYGSMHRMPRVSPDEEIQYRQWTIPKGVPVGMSAYFNHTDADIFTDPFAFAPDRWLPLNATPRMRKAMTQFTRGSRICLGSHLATSEVNHTIAMLFRPAGPGHAMRLYDTDESDVKSVHDFMIPLPKLDTKGFRIVVEPHPLT